MAEKKVSFTIGIPLLLDAFHFLEQRNCKTVFIKEQLKLQDAILQDPDGRAPVMALVDVWSRIILELSSDEAFLIFAKRNTQLRDGLGSVMASKSTALLFLKRWANHSMLVNPAVSLSVRTIDDEVELRIQIPEFWHSKRPIEAEQWGLTLLLEFILLMKTFYPDLKPILVRTRLSNRIQIGLFSDFINRPVFVDPSGHSIRFRSKDLEESFFDEDCTPSLLDDEGVKEWKKCVNPPSYFMLRDRISSKELFISGMGNAESEAFLIMTKSLLRGSFLATLEISLLFGFESHQQFSKFFRLNSGYLPRVWRKAYFKNGK